MALQLDHLMWGAPSLEAGMIEAERLFGVAPAPGGAHPGRGTCNALLSLGASAYLEVIAPDPAQNLEGNLGGRLAGLSAPALVTWAAAAPRLEALAAVATSLALTVRGPAATERKAPDGGLLQWELLFLGGHPHAGLMPFFIDWQATVHPALTSPAAGTFRELIIRSPQAAALNELFAGLDLAVRAEAGTDACMQAVIDTPAGKVQLATAAEAAGWSF